MTQEQLKEQFINYAEYNLNHDTLLKAIIELLDGVSNNLYYDGYTKESNVLTRCVLNIKGVLESGNI